MGVFFPEKTSIPYTSGTSIHYRHGLKRLLGRLILTNCQFIYYKTCCYYFLISVVNLWTNMKSFTTLISREFLKTINGMSHQFFAAGMQVKYIYLNLRKWFYKEHSNETWWISNIKIWTMDWSHAGVLTKTFMVVVEQWKKVTFYFKLKRTRKLWWWSYMPCIQPWRCSSSCGSQWP